MAERPTPDPAPALACRSPRAGEPLWPAELEAITNFYEAYMQPGKVLSAQEVRDARAHAPGMLELMERQVQVALRSPEGERSAAYVQAQQHAAWVRSLLETA